jgi:hypothetical protein
MIKRCYREIVLLAIFALCGSTTVFAAETTFETAAFKTGKARLILADAPLKAMTEIPLTITLTDGTGHNITDAKLHVSMDMPAMPMPPNNPAAAWDDDAYRGNAIFTMAGAWEITVNIDRKGFDKESVVFEIEQVMMK